MDGLLIWLIWGVDLATRWRMGYKGSLRASFFNACLLRARHPSNTFHLPPAPNHLYRKSFQLRCARIAPF